MISRATVDLPMPRICAVSLGPAPNWSGKTTHIISRNLPAVSALFDILRKGHRKARFGAAQKEVLRQMVYEGPEKCCDKAASRFFAGNE